MEIEILLICSFWYLRRTAKHEVYIKSPETIKYTNTKNGEVKHGAVSEKCD